MADHSSRSCPYDHANIFSKITFWWMNALFKLGSKNHLTSLNICDVSKDDESSLLQSKLEQYWKIEVQKYSEGQKASLFRAVLKAFKWQWIIPGILVLFFESIKLVQPYLIGLLVSYLNDDADAVPLETAYGIGACLGLSAILQICLNPTYFFVMQHVAMRMKVAVGALIYRKVLSLSSEAFQNTSAGQIVNLLSTDIEKFNSSVDLLHYFWVSPLSVGIVMYLIYRHVGAVCFWGLAVIVVIVPLQAGLSTVFGKLGSKIGAYSDRRIQLMSEVIIAMRVIKVHCWEQSFQSLISKLRRHEVTIAYLRAIINGFNMSVEHVSARVVLLVILIVTWTYGTSVGSPAVFILFGLCDILKYSAFYFHYSIIEKNVQFYASLSRVQETMLYILGAGVKGLNRGTEEICARVVAMTIFLSYYYMAGQSPDSTAVFFTLSLLDSVRLTGFYFPHYAAEVMSQLLASLQRLQFVFFLLLIDATIHTKSCNSIIKYEISLLRWCGMIQSIDSLTEAMTSRLALLVIVILLRYCDSIRSVDVFTTLAWLCVLQSIVLRFPVQGLQEIKKLHNSAQLVQAFLLLDEEKEQIKELRLHRSISYRNEPHRDWAIDIDHMTARWPLVYIEGRRRFQKKKQRSSTSSTKSLLHESDADHAFSLKYISLQVKKGELVTVVGVVGSGKSSLLMCLIGELPYEIGQISINGRVSYCGQTNWVFSGTLKDNILFGHSLNRNHYQRVIEACGLTRDLELLPKGDQTFVGERGLNLSGGQKARLSLARCVYHDADVYLLDDPFNAVDTSVGRHIFQRCIQGLLKEKTVVLVTHQLQYLKQADRIIVLRDGSIYDVGTYDELKSRGMNMKDLVSSDEHPKHISEAAREAEEEETKLPLESKHLNMDPDTDEGEEDVETGSVGFCVYWEYFCAGFGPALMPVLLPLWFAGPALYCLSDWMLSQWLTESQRSESKSVTMYNATTQTASALTVRITSTADAPRESDHMLFSLKVYIIAVAACSVAFILYAVLFLQMMATAGQRLHDRMLERVLNTITSFFETHSVGQVLNRFSRDLGVIDNSVSILSYIVSMRTTQYLGFFLVTVIANPWLTIALVPVLVSVVLIRMYALQTLRQIKRLEAKARSPVYSHMSDTILGLETIRALGKRDQFLAEFDEHQNNHTAAWFLYLSCYRWMSVRSLAAVVLYMNIIIFVSLGLKQSLNGNLLALSLIYCISMSEPFEFYVRASADLETYMTSVERVLEYCQLEQEPPKVSDKPPSPDWPNRGSITFTKTSLQYTPDAPLTLKNIECHIKGKEKIGIVGRTGSGKSSLITTLLRLAKPTGVIYIDGVDIGKLGLYELRSKISVIPQDPFLFSQTLRWNLDPLNEFSDERLWNALEQVQLKNKVELMPGKLYTEIQEGGRNLSVGQRQLICLARAILKYNRIIILDEATANVDQETDVIIQRTLRAKFRESTVLTIAHRLYTVMDCDRIIVLEDGELKEFDTPYNLLQNSQGIFTRLVLTTGKNSARQLQALAELSQRQRTSASIQLHRAMMLAHEQLAQSTEDLTANKSALSWNRFTHSQDSLEKIHIENIIEKEKKAVAPSKRIISRRSPARTKKTRDEEELLNYETPPTARIVSNASGKNLIKSEQTPNSDISEIPNDSRGIQIGSKGNESFDDSVKSHADNPGRKGYGSDERSIETTFDSSEEPLIKYQPSPSHESSTESRRVTHTTQQRARSPEIFRPNNREPPPATRILAGPYISLAQQDDKHEEFV